jgi:ferrous iron transport protein A
MTLDQLKENTQAQITKIKSNDELKQRFYSFGIIKGSVITVSKISLAKNTIEIIVEDTSIGMRIEEAKHIEVKVL